MYCPVCSTESSTDQKFCRSCGADLQIVLQALNGQLRPLQPEDQIEEQKKKLFRKGGLITWWGFMLTFTLVVVSVAMGSLGSDLQSFFILLSPIGTPVLVLGVAMMIYARFLLKAPRERKTTIPLPESSTPASLPGPVASVVESTTELLESSQARMRGRDTAPQNN